MHKLHFRPSLAVVCGLALAAAGCSGGGGGSAEGSDAPAAAITLAGTAATGAALANAPVTVTNSSGAPACQEASITTTALGSYTCTLKDGERAPFFIVVTDPAGTMAPLVSVASSTPAAGTPLMVNATPLTTAILAQIAPDGNPLTLVNSRAIDSAQLSATTENVMAQLSAVLTEIGAPAGYNPFTTSITAATASNAGNTADLVLDVVKVVTDPATGKLALTTVDNPTPVPLATATTRAAAVPAPVAGLSALAQAAQVAARAFTTCFALPVSQRVLSTVERSAAEGGAEVTAVAGACQNLAADGVNAGGATFLHNGYSAGQFFYGLLTNDAMTGAQFSVPEIMAFYPADKTASGNEEAALNIRFLDGQGNPGNIITIARNIPNTSSADRPTTWWLTGNHQPVDVSVRLNIRRVEQLNPNNSLHAKISTFQSGIQFSINAKGPGSVNASGDALTLARISGPGLPGNGAPGTGLVYKVSSNSSRESMDMYNKTGSLTVGSQCGNGVTFNCPNLWVARTAGVTGSGATTLASNPMGLLWAQPEDQMQPELFVKGARYKVELFYGTNTGTADVTLRKTLLSDMVPATQAVNLPWNTPGSQTMTAMSPSGSLSGTQAALGFDWSQNPAAQHIAGVQAVVNGTTGSFGPTKPVPKGATSVVLDNQTVPAFDATTTRTVLFGYRMLDSSNKTAVYTYN